MSDTLFPKFKIQIYIYHLFKYKCTFLNIYTNTPNQII